MLGDPKYNYVDSLRDLSGMRCVIDGYYGVGDMFDGSLSAYKLQGAKDKTAEQLKKFSEKPNKIQDEIKKLKERIEALEFIKDFQQDIIADYEKTTGLELAKKSLPETLVNEIEEKKKRLSK